MDEINLVKRILLGIARKHPIDGITQLFGMERVVFGDEVYVRTATLHKSAIGCGRADDIRERARKQSFFCNSTKISARTID